MDLTQVIQVTWLEWLIYIFLTQAMIKQGIWRTKPKKTVTSLNINLVFSYYNNVSHLTMMLKVNRILLPRPQRATFPPCLHIHIGLCQFIFVLFLRASIFFQFLTMRMEQKCWQYVQWDIFQTTGVLEWLVMGFWYVKREKETMCKSPLMCLYSRQNVAQPLGNSILYNPRH